MEITTKNKMMLVAAYPDGENIEIVKVPGLGWQWGHDSYSSHLTSAKSKALAAGACVIRRPNPNYRPPGAKLRLLVGGLGR